MTRTEFAAESLRRQRAYIAAERVRYGRALKTPGDKAAHAALDLHPLTQNEILGRFEELGRMARNAAHEYRADSAKMRAAYQLHCFGG